MEHGKLDEKVRKQLDELILRNPLWDDLASCGVADLVAESREHMVELVEVLDGFEIPQLGPVKAEPFEEDGEFLVLLTLHDLPNLFSLLMGMLGIRGDA